jgi:hypothetical protein
MSFGVVYPGQIWYAGYPVLVPSVEEEIVYGKEILTERVPYAMQKSDIYSYAPNQETDTGKEYKASVYNKRKKDIYKDRQ